MSGVGRETGGRANKGSFYYRVADAGGRAQFTDEGTAGKRRVWPCISGAAPLAEFVHGKRLAIGTAEEGRTVLKLISACYESAEQGKRINV